MKRTIIITLALIISHLANAQVKKVYNETIDPMLQIDSALVAANKENKFVICQVGGNWCKWCLWFADFIKKDADISTIIEKNYVYIHVNYPRGSAAKDLMTRLGNPGRFGYPAIVVLGNDGKVKHIQDSSFLEEGEGYNKDKVMRFLKNWTPEAVSQ